MATRASALKAPSAGVVGAAIASGGVGTAISVFAQSLPATSAAHVLLSAFAPAIDIGASGVSLFIKGVYIDPIANQKRHDSRQKMVKLLIAEARELYDRVREDPNSSPAHKESVRKNLERLELGLIEGGTERLLG